MRKSRKTGIILLVLIIILIILVLVIVYANLKNTPSWNDVNETIGTSKENPYSECVKFIDVGQGDSAVLTSKGKNAVIDVGTPEGTEKLCQKIKNLGINNIDVLMFSHNHDDHIGGAEGIVNAFSVKNLMLPDISRTKSPTRIIGNVTETVNQSGGKTYTARSGAYFNIGNIKVTVLCQFADQSNENDRSIIAMAQLGIKKFLFTGDAGKSVENRIVKEGMDIDCDVLKVGHHGSSGSSTDKFLEKASPDYAVISCGEGNTYKHPHEAAISRLENIGAKIYRTDLNGDITFYLNGKALKIETQK